MRRLAAVTVVGLLLAGCGSDEGRVCARDNDDAELCLAKTDGSYRIEGQGLKPGSQITTEVAGKPYGRPQAVGADGRPTGVIGFIGRGFDGLTVTAIAASGERLHVTVDDGR